ncbi:MAG: L,D-transpeptidase [Nitrospinota bacterium]|nr:L,D-transpeptidase [Nitrospinota bacterium]
MTDKKLNTLTIAEYNLIATKDPRGNYDRRTRENLYAIIQKLTNARSQLSPLEFTIHQKFRHAQFAPLDEKDKKVKLEVLRHLLSARAQRTLKFAGISLAAAIVMVLTVYHLFLGEAARKEVDVAYYAGLKKLGLASKEEIAMVESHLHETEETLVQTQKKKEELEAIVARMIENNKVAQNFKYIVRHIYDDPRTSYSKDNNWVDLYFGKNRIARYENDPDMWYLLGVIDTGMLKVFYNDEQILEIEAIFGRKDEETPLGEYEIKNRLHKPTWYKKEIINGKEVVRPIPFGDPDHEIGHWWLGLKKLGPKVHGSYGIHGVNISKANEFFRKNFDWRNGSAGCPNIQEWYLDYLAHVLPLGTRVNIVQKDKWVKST